MKTNATQFKNWSKHLLGHPTQILSKGSRGGRMLFGCNPNDQAMGKGIAFVCSSKPENGIAKYLKSKLMDLQFTHNSESF